MAVVMIGVDSHKGSHTAVAVGADEAPLGQVRVRASAAQAQRLAWAAWPERTRAVKGVGGLGHLLAQELVAAGEFLIFTVGWLAGGSGGQGAALVSASPQRPAQPVAGISDGAATRVMNRCWIPLQVNRMSPNGG
jgi:hypothetical protein